MPSPNLSVLRSAIGPLLSDVGQIGTVESVVNPETGLKEPMFVPHWTGPMLVRPERVEQVTVGSVERPRGLYDVTLPAETAVEYGHKVKLTECPGDPSLVGLLLTVTDVTLDAWAVARFIKVRTP